MNLICGINPVIEALNAGTRHFDRLLVVKGLRNRRLSDAIRRATRLGIPLRFEMREALDRMAGSVPHQGLIAVVSAKPLLSLDELLETARDPALLVALDGVEDPRNLGAILRSVEAAGADGTLVPERHSAGLSETVGRASAGALEHVQVARVGNLVQALETLKERGVWIVGFDAAGTERWDAVDLKRPVCLVLGGEGRGIRRLVREHCDLLVSIPHFGHVTSLNVSVAAGIALYEVVRQRGAVPSLVRPIPARPAPVAQVIGPGDDDTESDPGARPRPPALQAAENGPPVEDEPASIPYVDIHGEEVAWGQGPEILKPVVSRGRGRRPPPRRRKSGPRQQPPEAASRGKDNGKDNGEEKRGAAGSGSEESAGRQGRRRRRRKRSAGPRGEQGGRSSEGSAPQADTKAAPAEPSSPSGKQENGAPPRGRRRGRGRRR
jgi:23S rRNA (guanosine2251-2'-O)-methyltransferase